MKKFLSICAALVLACSVGVAGDFSSQLLQSVPTGDVISEESVSPAGLLLPDPVTADCSPEAQTIGQDAYDELIALVRSQGQIIIGSAGFCDIWDLDKKQTKNMAKYMVSDMGYWLPEEQCSLLLATRDKKAQFGNVALIECLGTTPAPNGNLVSTHRYVQLILNESDGMLITLVVGAITE